MASTWKNQGKSEQLHAGLPAGVRIVPFCDRTRLIHGAIDTRAEILAHEMIIESMACAVIVAPRQLYAQREKHLQIVADGQRRWAELERAVGSPEAHLDPSTKP